MKKLFISLIVVACVLVLIPAVSSAGNGPIFCLEQYELIAGGGNPKSATDVGNFYVFVTEGRCGPDYEGLLTAFQYVAHDPWCFSEIHFDLALAPEVFPQKNGNPIPGQFIVHDEFDGCIPAAAWCLPGVPPPFYIAAQQVVQYDGRRRTEESAWAGVCLEDNDYCEEWGYDFPGANWATFVDFDTTGCIPNGP